MHITIGFISLFRVTYYLSIVFFVVQYLFKYLVGISNIFGSCFQNPILVIHYVVILSLTVVFVAIMF
jgi:hypothetical protein